MANSAATVPAAIRKSKQRALLLKIDRRLRNRGAIRTRVPVRPAWGHISVRSTRMMHTPVSREKKRSGPSERLEGEPLLGNADGVIRGADCHRRRGWLFGERAADALARGQSPHR